MSQEIRKVMTSDPIQLASTATALDAAMLMRERNVGDVVIMDDGHIYGIVTDRDIVIRAIAVGRSPATISTAPPNQ